MFQCIERPTRTLHVSQRQKLCILSTVDTLPLTCPDFSDVFNSGVVLVHKKISVFHRGVGCRGSTVYCIS